MSVVRVRMRVLMLFINPADKTTQMLHFILFLARLLFLEKKKRKEKRKKIRITDVLDL